MTETISIAIETTSVRGGICLGRGESIVGSDTFDASQRHATHLVSKLKAMLAGQGVAPADVGELYVSAGPGSFTGTRVGITVARTMAQAIAGLKCVSVPTPWAIARQCLELTWLNLAVFSDTSEGGSHVSFFTRGESDFEPTREGVMTPEEFLKETPRPILCVGDGLKFGKVAEALAGSGGVELLPADEPHHAPTAQAVWQVGRSLASQGKFTEYHHLLPIYSRSPEAVRLWEKKQEQAAETRRRREE